MGIDKSLNDDYPSILINGSHYHFGRHPGPEGDYYLIENAHIAKDYWWFEKKEDFVAFLVNLPESADRHRMEKLYPDWHLVSPKEQEAYIEDSRTALRATMEEKQKDGTARHFPIYPDDGSGPYRGQEPFRIESQEPPLARIERAIHDLKYYGPFDHGLTDAGKLATLERLDWTGVGDKDKEAILRREVKFDRITQEQFEFVYEDLRDDFDDEFNTGRRVSDELAPKLFTESTAPGKEQAHSAATVHFNGFACEVEWATYANGRPALTLVDTRDREMVAVATVNLPGAPQHLGEVFIKDYSENEGMLAALEKAGIVKATGETVQSGFAKVPVAKVLQPNISAPLAERLFGHPTIGVPRDPSASTAAPQPEPEASPQHRHHRKHKL